MDLQQALQDLKRITEQRNRYRDALVRIICAPSIRDARRIVSQTFKEDAPCQKPVGAGLIPPAKPPSRPPA